MLRYKTHKNIRQRLARVRQAVEHGLIRQTEIALRMGRSRAHVCNVLARRVVSLPVIVAAEELIAEARGQDGSAA